MLKGNGNDASSKHGLAMARFDEEEIIVAQEELAAYCAPSMEHPVAIVLGSGLGALADRVHVVRRIPYEDIEGFPREAIPVEGHRFEVLVGTIDEVPVVVYPGRVHLYQGYSALQVTSLVRHAHRLGCRDIILTCASGAVGDVEPGTFGLITDHMNLTGCNPLATPEGASHSLHDTPFVPVAGAYSNYLTQFAREAAAEVGVPVAEGTYVGMLGPSYETDAEVHALHVLGADFVGCSTVCEVIMAQALRMQVLGLTLVTSKAGRPDNNHAEVVAAAEAAADKTTGALLGVLRRLREL